MSDWEDEGIMTYLHSDRDVLRVVSTDIMQVCMSSRRIHARRAPMEKKQISDREGVACLG